MENGGFFEEIIFEVEVEQEVEEEVEVKVKGYREINS